MGKTPEEKDTVFIVDFGLAKEHIDPATKYPFSPRRNTDFRGTIPYASLNAHHKQELSRRDDLWSFFFMLLEFLDEPLSWKQSESILKYKHLCIDTNKEEVRDIKSKALKNP